MGPGGEERDTVWDSTASINSLQPSSNEYTVFINISDHPVGFLSAPLGVESFHADEVLSSFDHTL